LNLPQMSGFELCRRLRAEAMTARVPVLMLTARTDESDKVLGLNLGADDYITKPFSMRELVARVRAVLRRSEGADTEQQIFDDGILKIDPLRQQVGREQQRDALARVWHRDALRDRREAREELGPRKTATGDPRFVRREHTDAAVRARTRCTTPR